jgi:hypothetical protein
MIRSENRRKRPKFEKFPVKFPVSREFDPETGSPLTGSSAKSHLSPNWPCSPPHCAYDAFSLSPVTVVARVRASHRVENFQRDCLGCFCRFERLAIARIRPGASKAEEWIAPAAFGSRSTFGVFADAKSNTLWVCSNEVFARQGLSIDSADPIQPRETRTLRITATDVLWRNEWLDGLIRDADSRLGGLLFLYDATGKRYIATVATAVIPKFD